MLFNFYFHIFKFRKRAKNHFFIVLDWRRRILSWIHYVLPSSIFCPSFHCDVFGKVGILGVPILGRTSPEDPGWTRPPTGPADRSLGAAKSHTHHTPRNSRKRLRPSKWPRPEDSSNGWAACSPGVRWDFVAAASWYPLPPSRGPWKWTVPTQGKETNKMYAMFSKKSKNKKTNTKVNFY